jgi:hypothetical protein
MNIRSESRVDWETTGAFEGVNMVKSKAGQQVEEYHPDEHPLEGLSHSAFSDEIDDLCSLTMPLSSLVTTT